VATQESANAIRARASTTSPEVTDGRLARYVQRGDIVFRDLEDLLAHLRVHD
jgi:hypothetical protein